MYLNKQSSTTLLCISRGTDVAIMVVPERQLYIGGAWTKPLKQQTFDVYSPSTGSKFGIIPAATAEDVDKAISAALKAFKSGSWSKKSGAHRAKYLRAIADKVLYDLASYIYLAHKAQSTILVVLAPHPDGSRTS